MIQGYFGEKGELFFEIELIGDDGSVVTVNALLDTGFTDWLAMDIQDAESLGWTFIRQLEMRIARGNALFNLYVGSVLFDGQEFTIPVLGGREIPEFLIGLPWLENWRLVVDRKAGLLTLGED
ncbi:aspartyl protease [Planktothrix sp. FACHB-1355]|uniref:Aspartyl protease n=1 Tax=Aerosakkonema funiforme FACHB-1375 TaxID=2949571 RepID=A0A926VJJ8_9CYAN|nr:MULTISPECIES: aspartyl protease [Oscillatoriales]MBD2183674.1 aspartyl protease [Aerosakkonema funiforme FACHB-1375]MBD3560498.1 aspartyl protease [Planktothrix sp. FACHB-1355]